MGIGCVRQKRMCVDRGTCAARANRKLKSCLCRLQMKGHRIKNTIGCSAKYMLLYYMLCYSRAPIELFEFCFCFVFAFVLHQSLYLYLCFILCHSCDECGATQCALNVCVASFLCMIGWQ